MSNTVDLIRTTVTPEALWGIVGNIVPIALVVTLFSLGFYLVRRQLKKVAKAKSCREL